MNPGWAQLLLGTVLAAVLISCALKGEKIPLWPIAWCLSCFVLGVLSLRKAKPKP